MHKSKIEYERPVIEVLSICVEAGIATSYGEEGAAGGVLNVRDTVVDKIGSQTDMVATLYAQLGMDASAFRYSKNLMDASSIPFAFYAFGNAAAIINEEGACIYDLRTKKNIGSNQNPNTLELVKAYLQVLNQDFKQ